MSAPQNASRPAAPSAPRPVTGVDGIFALGSSGEVAFHDDALRDQVLEAVTGAVAGQVPVLAGVIDMETNRVLTHLRAAERHDVDGIVATAPFYAITGPDELMAHFRAIAAASSVPVRAYGIPVCVHLKLGLGQIMELAAEGALAGVKDSSGDDVAYLAGADGSVPGLGNVDPAGYVRMHAAAVAEDWATVRREQDRLAALFEIVFAPTGKVGPAAGVGAFKTALRELGVFSSNAMSVPMTPIKGEAVDRVRGILEAAKLLGSAGA
ncbi:dihydrodipicolinate synthase family protein [Brachybacterium sp. DNPG3]